LAIAQADAVEMLTRHRRGTIMQRFYEAIVGVGIAVMALGEALGLLFCVVSIPEGMISLLGWGYLIVFGCAVAVGIPLFIVSRLRPVAGPKIAGRTWFKIVYYSATILFIGAFLFGICRWPAAPLTSTGAGYQDKRGKQFSREEFEVFERWEAVLGLFGAAFAVSAFIGLPGYKSFW
jgi:hypothetical protein